MRTADVLIGVLLGAASFSVLTGWVMPIVGPLWVIVIIAVGSGACLYRIVMDGAPEA